MPDAIADYNERDIAVRRAQEVGYAKAAEEHGVKVSTLRTWMKRYKERVAKVASEPSPPALVEAVHSIRPTAVLTGDLPVLRDGAWVDRVETVTNDWGALAAQAVEYTQDALARGDVNAAKASAVVAGIATDKANLLSGGVTARTESKTLKVDAAVSDLVALLNSLKR